jgi:hypothetical protein
MYVIGHVTDLITICRTECGAVLRARRRHQHLRPQLHRAHPCQHHRARVFVAEPHETTGEYSNFYVLYMGMYACKKRRLPRIIVATSRNGHFVLTAAERF